MSVQTRKMIPTKELRQKEQTLYKLKREALEKLDIKTNRGFNSVASHNDYENSLYHTLLHGTPKFDRTGTGTIGIHGYQSKFDLDAGFPLITTKKVHIESVIHELIWLVSGSTNIKYLVDNNVTIWDDWPFKNWWQTTNPEASFPQKDTEKWKEMKMNDSLIEFRQNIKSDSKFAEKWGDLGPVYGKQWRKWSSDNEAIPIDQLQQVVDTINKQHETGTISRRMLVSAWNVSDIPAMLKSGLPPCHCLFQFHSRLMTLKERIDCLFQSYYHDNDPEDANKHLYGNTKKRSLTLSEMRKLTDDELDELGIPVYQLDLQLYQRSCDIFIGVPFNIASYAGLLKMVAQVTNCKPGTFIHDYGDLHIYANHFDQVVKQLQREPRAYPKMTIDSEVKTINDFKFKHFKLENYNPHSGIKASVAI